MKIDELNLILKEMQGCYEAAGVKKPADDFAHMQEILRGHEDETLDEFIANLQPKLLRKPKRSAPKPDYKLIEEFVTRLSSAGSNDKEIDLVLSELSSNKKIRKAEVDEITMRYTGSSTKPKTKKAGLESIKSKYIRQVRLEGKMDIVGRLNHWQ